MAEKEYRIPIQVEISANMTSEDNDNVTPKDNVSEDSTPKTKKENSNTAKTMAIYMGKQAAQYLVSNYGNLTGDYMGQANLSAGIELGSMAMMVAKGGAVGAVVAAGTLAVKGLNYYLDNKKSENRAKALRERVGLR